MKKLLLLLIPITFLQAQQGLRSPAYVAQLQRPAAGGGSPAWHYSIAVEDANNTGVAADAAVPIGSKVIPSVSGTASQLGVWITNYSGTVNCKLAMYNSSLGRLQDGGAVSITGNGWFNVNIANQAVTASTTYYVFFQAEVGSQWNWAYKDSGDANTEYNGNLAYASFPPDPFVSDGSLNRTYPCRIYVTP